MSEHSAPMTERLLARHAPDYGVLPCGWLPVDIDTFAMDNSGTAKEGVGRTYVGVDGYCPIASYLGRYGFCLELSLRPGTQHWAKHTGDNLRADILGLGANDRCAEVFIRMNTHLGSSGTGVT